MLFHGSIWTCYRQLYVASPDCRDHLPEDATKGQSNGLCGGAVPGALFLTVGIHTGSVPLRVMLYDAAPPIDPSWDEIVEASCSFTSVPVHLQSWAGEKSVELALSVGQYRARFCAKSFGTMDELGEGESDASAEDYLLAFWADVPKSDMVIKQTSDRAAYWHREARKTAQN